MVQLLSDAIGSRYVTDGNSATVRNLVSQTTVIYDLADCLITKKIAEVVEKNPKRFIDTKDPARQRIIDRNLECERNQLSLTKDRLPPFSGKYIDYFLALSPDILYEILAEREITIAACAYVLRPDCMFTFGFLTQTLGTYLCAKYYDMDQTKFMETLTSGVPLVYYNEKYLEDVTAEIKDGHVYLSNGVHKNVRDAMRSLAVLPKDIGSVKLDARVYREFWSRLLNAIQNLNNDIYTLYDFIKGVAAEEGMD